MIGLAAAPACCRPAPTAPGPACPRWCCSCGAAGAVFFGTEVYLPLLLQERYGLPAWLSGITLTAAAVAWALASAIQGRLDGRLRAGTAMRWGAGLLAAGAITVLLTAALTLPPAVGRGRLVPGRRRDGHAVPADQHAGAGQVRARSGGLQHRGEEHRGLGRRQRVAGADRPDLRAAWATRRRGRRTSASSSSPARSRSAVALAPASALGRSRQAERDRDLLQGVHRLLHAALHAGRDDGVTVGPGRGSRTASPCTSARPSR